MGCTSAKSSSSSHSNNDNKSHYTASPSSLCKTKSLATELNNSKEDID